jgi:hypothetical protein
MTTINISKNKIKKIGGLVILPVKEYECLRASVTPTYYLSGKAAKDLDKLVKGGVRNYKSGKTKVLRSLADLK